MKTGSITVNLASVIEASLTLCIFNV